MGRNFGWLLGGRGFQAAASLLYLGMAARALGAEGFGAFTLTLAYGQAIANLAQFQSWQSVIRYGALHRAHGNPRRLERLLGFTASLDAAAAIGGAILAVTLVPAIGPLLGWNAGQQQQPALFAGALLLSVGATPIGMLRLYDRFDLVALAQATSPLARLAGAVAAWLAGGGVSGFLAVWAGAALLQSAAMWALALRHVDPRPAFGRRRLRLARGENQGVLRFMLVTNAASTLGSLADQVGTLAVGAVAGAATAGGYRLAAKLARSLARPIQMLAVVVFPEFARLRASREQAAIARLTARATNVALVVAVVLVAAAALAGEPLLRLLSGITYPDARLYLMLFALASAIELSGFALEQLLTSGGAPERVLAIRASGVVAYLILLAVLLPSLGPAGAAAALIGSALVTRLLLGRAVSALR